MSSAQVIASDDWLGAHRAQERTFGPHAVVAERVAEGVFAPHARSTSVQIVAACLQYAASVRYNRVRLSDLSTAAHVSERRVRHAFSECLHVSPTTGLRVAALLEVRRSLLWDHGARDAVTRAASDFGFWHLGRFASQYRRVFGESPSATVARARALDRRGVSEAGLTLSNPRCDAREAAC